MAKIIVPDIQAFTCYRAYLEEFWLSNRRRNVKFSHRHLARKVGWPISYLSDILKQRKTLSLSRALQFARFVGLNVNETERLIFLALCETDDVGVKKYFSRKLATEASWLRIRREKRPNLIDDVEALAVFETFRWARGPLSPKSLQSLLYTYPTLKATDIKRILEHLEASGYILRTADGSTRLNAVPIFMDDDDRDLVGIHKKYAENSIRFCERPKGPAIYNALFVELPVERFDEIADRLVAVRNWIMTMSEETRASYARKRLQDTRVFQLDINLFPIIDKNSIGLIETSD